MRMEICGSCALSNLTLGGWIGHDNNASLAPLTGYNNNASTGLLANAIYQADPAAWGVQDRFTLDGSVISSTVHKRQDNDLVVSMSMVVISMCRVRPLPTIGLKMALHKRPTASQLVDRIVIMLVLGLEF